MLPPELLHRLHGRRHAKEVQEHGEQREQYALSDQGEDEELVNSYERIKALARVDEIPMADQHADRYAAEQQS